MLQSRFYKALELRQPRHFQRLENGSVLIIGLVFLFAMSVLSVSSLSGVATQERRAANSNAKNQAEHAALSAIHSFLDDLEADDATALAHMTTAVEAAGGEIGPITVPVPSGSHSAQLFLLEIDRNSNQENSQDDDLSSGSIDAVYMEVIARGFNTENPQINVEIRRGFRYQ